MPFRRFVNNGRKEKIHINMKINATAFDTIKSYYFSRILDMEF